MKFLVMVFLIMLCGAYMGYVPQLQWVLNIPLVLVAIGLGTAALIYMLSKVEP